MRFIRMLGVIAVVLAVALPAAATGTATGKSESKTHVCGNVSPSVGAPVAFNIKCKAAKQAIANNFAGYTCTAVPHGVGQIHTCKKNGHPGKSFRYLSH